jgi:hypothetical protein
MAILDEASAAASTRGAIERASEEYSRTYAAEILLVSFAALLLEISYTRIVSFKLFYYYTYLVIGLALLGIGFGGVLVTVSDRLRRAATETIMLWGLLLGAASVVVGYYVVATIPIDTFRIWDYGTRASVSSMVRLLVVCVALFASFVTVGVMISTLFGRKSDRIGGLYFADLVGAGIACAVVVALISSIGPPATIFLAGLVQALAGLRIALRRRSPTIPLAGALAVLLAAIVAAPSFLPDPRQDRSKFNLRGTENLFSKWSPIFRVDVNPFAGRRLLYHDGLLGSNIYEFDGDVSKLTRFDSDPRSFGFAVRGRAPRNVMIIGAAGGHEILASLYFDAAHIDAIELNPVTHRLVTRDFAAYSGRLAENPRVNYVNGDGRSYLARSDKTYDMVWFPATDSYAATNAATAGAYVLSESYLYTTGAIIESLKHTSPTGVLATQFGEFDYDNRPNRTTRYVSTARKALEHFGVTDVSRHILVARSLSREGGSLSTIIVKRQPFTIAEIRRFEAQQPRVPGSTAEYVPGAPRGNSVSAIATLPGRELDRWYDDYPYDVRPVTDDGPFFWHFSRFGDVIRDFDRATRPGDVDDAIGERVLLLLLGVATLFSAVFLLLPFVAIRRTWTQLPRKRRSALYFACLGLGFMFFEITLIQRLTLFLGFPTYSLTVTLASLLIFTGIGALVSARTGARRHALPVLLAAIAALTFFYQFGLPPLTDALLSQPLGLRVVVAFLVLAPLGLCLGTFMPLGLGAVARLTEHPREYVAWGWAVNGFASVVGAVLTTILAMSFGFKTVLFLALAAYAVALLSLRGLRQAPPIKLP